MKKISLFLIASLLICYSCSNNKAQSYDKQTLTENKFKDFELQEIYNFQNERNTKKLLEYFNHSKISCKEAAVLAFASVQDSNAIDGLLKILENEESEKVKIASAFAIGQIGNSKAENSLIRLFKHEKSVLVKQKILESIGKCGTEKGLSLLIGLTDIQINDTILQGRMLGFARFSIRGIFSEAASKEVFKVLATENTSAKSKFNASIALTRLPKYDLAPFFSDLVNAFENTTHVFTKINLASALSKVKNDEGYNYIGKILKDNEDYRVKVNAIKSLTSFKYSNASKLIFNSLSDSNINIAIQASEYFITHGVANDVSKYKAYVNKVNNWRVRTNLLTAALKYSENKKVIVPAIVSGYKASKNIYEKANLLKSLGGNISSYQFVRKEIQESKELVIKTYGMEALANMRRNEEFEKFNKIWINQGKGNLSKEFAFIFKEAIMSGDIAMVGIAAEVIRDEKLDFRKQYENSYFLNQALNKCRLPKDIEAYRELQKTIAFINGTEIENEKPSKPLKIDWEHLAQIPHNQIVEIITSKGSVWLELHINKAPISVANFLKLISEKYYHNRPIHRVAPNFVVQDGCPRGDGWGGPDYSINSEFPLNYYTEGSLGMASAGKDTESSQWFITHSPTPHLDGRYSNFGTVIKGMDVVQLLEVGDVILEMKALSLKEIKEFK